MNKTGRTGRPKQSSMEAVKRVKKEFSCFAHISGGEPKAKERIYFVDIAGVELPVIQTNLPSYGQICILDETPENLRMIERIFIQSVVNQKEKIFQVKIIYQE